MKSIRQLILEDIESTLASVNTAAGYSATFKAKNISRSAIDLDRAFEWPTALIGSTDIPQSVTSAGAPGQDLINRLLTVTITLGLNGQLAALSADVEGVVTDIGNAMAIDPTRGGYACDTEPPEIREPTHSQILEGHAFITLSFDITYRHRRTDATIA